MNPYDAFKPRVVLQVVLTPSGAVHFTFIVLVSFCLSKSIAGSQVKKDRTQVNK